MATRVVADGGQQRLAVDVGLDAATGSQVAAFRASTEVTASLL
jgi:hypothetical protein